MNLYKRIRAAISRRRRPPDAPLTADELALVRLYRYCGVRGITFTWKPYTRRDMDETLRRLGAENAKRWRAVEGWDRWTTIEKTGFDPD